MARPVILSNGQLMVGLDNNGLVHDFYYPYVGLDNLTNARSVHHKIGVWTDGRFSWVDDGNWNIKTDFDNDALISSVSMDSETLGVKLEFRDFVDSESDAFIRRVKVTNIKSDPSEVRLFMHQVFQISRAGRADTALYVPDLNYVLDYKGHCALLVYGQTKRGESFDQYAVGNYAIEGKEGTFKDAEDGELSGNAVEHGGVDSVIRFKLCLGAGESGCIDYWIVAAQSEYDAEQIHKSLAKDGIDKREQSTKEYWQKWLSLAKSGLGAIDKKYLELVQKSLMIIKAHCDRRGGVLASGDSSIFNYGRDYYCYCWPRDGAYAMWPLIRLGYTNEPKKFFEFCRDTLHKDGYLMHKYQPDKAIGSTWHPLIHDKHQELAIQEDETAIVICMLGEYYDITGDNDFARSMYTTLVKPAADFMAKFIDEETGLPHASYDIWEEKFLTTTYAAAIVEHALKRAAKFAEIFEHSDDGVVWARSANQIHESSKLFFNPSLQAYRKGFHLQTDGALNFDNTIDISSLYGVLMFGDIKAESVSMVKMAAAVEKSLANLGPHGGVARYENDYYMRADPNKPPNPWFVCTLWLAQYYIQEKQIEKAKKLLDWSLDFMMPSGVLGEQINAETGEPVSVAPLIWSHSEFVNTVLDLADESIQ